MQDITPPLGVTAQLIQSYGAEGFRIGNQNYSDAVLVTPNATFAWDGGLELQSFAALFALEVKPDVLLLGTGARHEMIPPDLRTNLRAQGIVVDTMDTGAACRTFNILLGEGRRVAAALRLPRI